MPKMLTSKDGALWIQPDGANTETFFLGCHDVSDLTDPKGAKSLLQCFRADNSGWDVVGDTISPPDAVTLTITSLLFPQRDWLERVHCPYALYLLMRDCGSANVFNNYVRGQLLTNVKNAQRSFSNMVMRTEDTEASVATDVEAWPPLLDIDRLIVDRITTAETENLNDVVGNDNERCAGDCGETLTKGMEVGAPADGNTANVQFSDDEGLTFAPANTDPFVGAVNAIAIQRFTVGRDTVRWLVAEEALGAGVQGHVAYSDNAMPVAGATWTRVNIEGVTGSGAISAGGIFAIDQKHIWMCGIGAATDDGYIWFSNDGGESWITQEAGIISPTNGYTQIHFADEYNGMAVGVAGMVVHTGNGGASWAQVTVPVAVQLQTVHMIDANSAWVGASNGTIWYTNDAGVTWNQRVGWNVTVGLDIRDIDFANDYQGIMAVNSAGLYGHLYYTTDGGYTWDLLDTPVNEGLNAVWIAKTPRNQGLAYSVGEVETGVSNLAVILKVSIQ